jgi:diphthamide biosynthesis methyltransferase
MSNRSTHADIEKEHKFWSTQVPGIFAASIHFLASFASLLLSYRFQPVLSLSETLQIEGSAPIETKTVAEVKQVKKR